MEGGEVFWLALTRSQVYPGSHSDGEAEVSIPKPLSLNKIITELRMEGSKAWIDDFSKSFYNKLRARERGAGRLSVGAHVETHVNFHSFYSTYYWSSVLKPALWEEMELSKKSQ